MKNKILIALLFLTNFSSAFAQTSIGIGEKILLLPIHTCIPMDSDHNNGRGETDFNQICAIIKGKDLYVKRVRICLRVLRYAKKTEPWS